MFWVGEKDETVSKVEETLCTNTQMSDTMWQILRIALEHKCVIEGRGEVNRKQVLKGLVCLEPVPITSPRVGRNLRPES